MNKSPKEMGPNSFVQTYRKNPGVFIKFLKFLEVKQSIIRSDKEVGQLCANVEYA